MALVINTNIASLVAQQNLDVNSTQLKLSVQRLSSGYRVNSSADDAAGLARADQLRTQSRMVQASLRNTNDGISALEISDKAAERMSNILARLGELAASGAQGTIDSTTRGYYSGEFDKLVNEISRIAATTEFGGSKLLDGSVTNLTLFVGFKNSANDSLNVSLASLTTGANGLNLSTGIMSGVTGSLSAIDSISAAIKTINDARAVYGAASSRLSTTVANLQVTFTNFQAAESRIRDADFAYETAIYTRNQILVQAGTSVLAQANTLPQAALTLLQ